MNSLVDYDGSDSGDSDSELASEGLTVLGNDGSPNSKKIPKLPPPARNVSAKPAALAGVEDVLEPVVNARAWETKEAPTLPKTKKRRLVRLALPEMPTEDSEDEDAAAEARERDKMKKLHRQSGLLSSLPAPIQKTGARLLLPGSVMSKSRTKLADSKLNPVKPVSGPVAPDSGTKINNLGVKPVGKTSLIVGKTSLTVGDSGVKVEAPGWAPGISTGSGIAGSSSVILTKKVISASPGGDESDNESDEESYGKFHDSKDKSTNSDESRLDFLGLAAKVDSGVSPGGQGPSGVSLVDIGPREELGPPTKAAVSTIHQHQLQIHQQDPEIYSYPQIGAVAAPCGATVAPLYPSWDHQSYAGSSASTGSSSFLNVPDDGMSSFAPLTISQPVSSYPPVGVEPWTSSTSSNGFIPFGHQQQESTDASCSSGTHDVFAQLPPEVVAQMGRDKKAMGRLMKSSSGGSSGSVMIDGRADALLGDVQQTLLKARTEEAASGMRELLKKTKEGPQPTSLQKQKHQITYLAHRAKEREALLQQEWAANRHSKRQTQSRYGFI